MTIPMKLRDGEMIPLSPDEIVEAARIAETEARQRAPVRTVTPLQFLDRFTPEEEEAVATSPQAAVWRTRALAAGEIDLDSEVTQAGLGFLVMIGLLTAERVAEILA